MVNKLDKIRAEIDEADASILAALSARQVLVGKVGALKKEGAVFRPAREAQLLRRLLAQGKMDPVPLTYIWRQIIATSLHTQQPHRFGLWAGAGAGDRAAARKTTTAFASAKAWAGAESEIELFDGCEDLFRAMKNTKPMLGFIPCDEVWWQHQPADIFLVARWNYIEDAKTLPLFIFSQTPPEPSGDDCAVLVKNNQLTMEPQFKTEANIGAGETLLGCFPCIK